MSPQARQAVNRSKWFYAASLVEIALATDLLTGVWDQSNHVNFLVPAALAFVGVSAALWGRTGAFVSTGLGVIFLLSWQFSHAQELRRVDFFSAVLYCGTALLLASLAMQRRALAAQIVEQEHQLLDAIDTEAELSRAKDDFLSLVAHELRNPVTVIVGAARLLGRNQRVDEEERELVHDVIIESARVQALIEDLLSLARLEAGLGSPPEPVLVQRVVPQAVAVFHERYGNEVTVNVEPLLPPVAASPVYVERVLSNLLTNAGKYAPTASPIRVEARRLDGDIAVDVLDTGPGVAPAELDRIFERFHQERSEDIRGYGLGLTISQRLVEANQGRIWAKNREGGGLDVGFSFPLYQE